MNSIREIIYSWHSGQWSAMYAFASSGIIEDLDALQIEISEIDDDTDRTAILRMLDDLQQHDACMLAPWAFEYMHSAYFDRFSFDLSTREILSIPSHGDCHLAVQSLADTVHGQAIRASLDPADVRKELREYGAWDDDALTDDEENFMRMLWIAACDMRDMLECTK